MSDDTAKRGPQDRTRIALEQPHEVRYWTRKWGIDEETLAAAVREAGPSSSKVAEYLQQQGKVETESTLPKLFRSAVSAITGGGDEDAITLLERDHREVEALFERFDELTQEGTPGERMRVVEEICALLTVHAAVEEELFYPAARRAAKDARDLVDEADVEHSTMKDLIARIEGMRSSEELFRATVTVLKEYVEHHVREEEKELFPKVSSSDLDLDRLGRELEERKLELLTQVTSEGIGSTGRTPSSAGRNGARRGSSPRAG